MRMGKPFQIPAPLETYSFISPHRVQSGHKALVEPSHQPVNAGNHAAVRMAGNLEVHAVRGRFRGQARLVGGEDAHPLSGAPASALRISGTSFPMMPATGSVTPASTTASPPRQHVLIVKHPYAQGGQELHPLLITGIILMIARHAEHPVPGLQIRKRPQIIPVHGTVPSTKSPAIMTMSGFRAFVRSTIFLMQSARVMPST